MTNYTNEKTGEIVTLISNKGGQAIIEDKEHKQLKITSKTFERWYKKVDGSVETPEQSEQTSNGELEPNTKTPPPAKTPKEKKAPREKITGDNSLLPYLRELAVSKSLDIFDSGNANFKAFKREKSYVMPFTFNTKNVTLWVKEDVLKDIKVEHQYSSHTYNARVKITEDTSETRALIAKILDAAIINLNERQAKSVKKEEEKAARVKAKEEKAAKAEQAKKDKQDKKAAK